MIDDFVYIFDVSCFPVISFCLLRYLIDFCYFQSIMETMLPKLVAEDIPLLHSLLNDVFPNVEYREDKLPALREEIKKVCKEMHLDYGDSGETGKARRGYRKYTFSVSLPTDYDFIRFRNIYRFC